MPTHAFATAALLLIATTAQATTLLLIPSAQSLTAKGEIFVVDDGRLNPRVGGRVN